LTRDAGAPQHVLHIIARLSLGGASRAMITGARHSQRTTGTAHWIASLVPPEAAAVALASRAGLELVGPVERRQAIEKADIVHVHFWNSPELHSLLREALPPMRIALTSHVAGFTSPHILTDELIERVDRILLTSPHSLERAGEALRAKASVAQSPADFERLAGVRPEPHEGFTIGYIGTVDFAKMEPRFASMHAALEIPDFRVLVCGDGGARSTLERQIDDLGVRHRFELLGYVEDIAPVLSGLDAFGYPLRENNYATTELVLHEALYAGVPPVVLGHAGAAATIRHGETGFIAASEADYADRLVQLSRDPELRTRMGAAAAADARARFGAENLAPHVDRVYRQMLELPKRAREGRPTASGAEALIRSLGPAGSDFRASLEGGAAAPESDDRIAAADPALASADAGGVLHYRRAFADDPALRYWSGLILLNQGRPALAAAEFTTAAAMGFDSDRSSRQLERARSASAHQ
jgi:glycosyltransferase involved in cell wall biosynthesis